MLKRKDKHTAYRIRRKIMGRLFKLLPLILLPTLVAMLAVGLFPQIALAAYVITKGTHLNLIRLTGRSLPYPR